MTKKDLITKILKLSREIGFKSPTQADIEELNTWPVKDLKFSVKHLEELKG